jgi:hypothetical protein
MIQRKDGREFDNDNMQRTSVDKDNKHSDVGRDGDYNTASTENTSREEGNEDYDDELEEAYDDEVKDESNSYVSYDGNSNANEPDSDR